MLSSILGEDPRKDFWSISIPIFMDFWETKLVEHPRNQVSFDFKSNDLNNNHVSEPNDTNPMLQILRLATFFHCKSKFYPFLVETFNSENHI